MHLKLKGGGVRLSIDSTIGGFEELVEQAARAAAQNGLAPDQNTARNLRALGITRQAQSPTVAYGMVDQ
jgi:hypothetical protein